jgi:hypothetical protein
VVTVGGLGEVSEVAERLRSGLAERGVVAPDEGAAADVAFG